MNWKKLIFIAAVICMFMPAFCSFAAAQEGDISFDALLPPNASMLDNKEFRMAGRQYSTVLYSSSDDSAAVADYYRNFFSRQGFQKILDKPEPEMKKQLLRFKKGERFFAVAVVNKQGKAEVTIAKYLQKQGEPVPEKTQPSLAELFAALPQKDDAGADLDFVPRPPQSIRSGSAKNDTTTTLLYLTPMDVFSTIDFYKKEMPSLGWELKKENAGAKGMEGYQLTRQRDKDAPASAFFEEDGFKQVIGSMYILDFSADFAGVEIAVLPDVSKTPSGSVVKVTYSEK